MAGDDLEGAVAPVGSTLFYALRRVPDPARLSCVGLFALHKELHDLVFSRSDMTHVKFGWWFEEIGRLLGGKPRHPATRAISNCRISEPAVLGEWIDNLEPFIGISAFQSEEELLTFSAALSEPLFLACATLAADAESGDIRGSHDRIYNTAVAFTLFKLIENLGRYLRDGILAIPRSDLEPPDISASDILGAKKISVLEHTMQRQIDRTMKHLTDSLSNVTQTERQNQYVGLTISAIHTATLREVQRNGCDTIDRHMDITPLRKAWIAWNTHRKTR